MVKIDKAKFFDIAGDGLFLILMAFSCRKAEKRGKRYIF